MAAWLLLEDNSLFVEAYQLERDGTTDIGGDFKKSDTQSTNSVDTCTHVIDAGSQLVDSSDAMLRDWGKNHTWCVRSLVKEEGRGELSSYWSCDNVVVEWMTEVSGTISSGKDEDIIPGTLVSVSHCEDIVDDECAPHNDVASISLRTETRLDWTFFRKYRML